MAGYTVSGNSLLANGQDFRPYGMTVYGLAYPEWQPHVASDEAQIQAIAKVWHGNTIRVQVAPTDLLQGAGYNEAFLAAVKQEVQTARNLGLNVILSAQYERTSGIPMPDSSTVAFWKIMAPIYSEDSGVWFDLFNEPDLGGNNTGSNPSLWAVWRNGGMGDIGMQQLVDTIRPLAPNNIIVAEGLEKAETLLGLPGAALSGSNIVYAVHPYFDAAFPDDPSFWDENWGDLSSTYPVIVDEWGEFEGNQKNCQTDAPTLVPTFLEYLSSHDIGLVAWSLTAGLFAQKGNLTVPTSFSSNATYTCRASASGNGEGAGSDLLSYFQANSKPAPTG
jgi:hypothetical protein